MSVRTNLSTNPSFENNVTGWNVYPGEATIARSTVRANIGAASGLITWPANMHSTNQVYMPFAAVVGKTYTLSIAIWVPSGSPDVSIEAHGHTTTTSLKDQWVRTSATAVATVTTENIVISPRSGLGGTCYIDAALFEQAPLAASYFDGSFPTGTWSGTAGNSTSTLAGAPAITVAGDAGNVPPRQIIFVTGSPGVTVRITRTDPDGSIRPVRTAEAGPLVGGQWSGYDYESPFDPNGTKTLTYTAQPSDGSTPFTTTVPALVVSQSWLIHPGVPDLSQPVMILDADPGETFDSGATLHNVLGRATPIAVTDGIRRSAASSFTLGTETAGDSVAMAALLADTAPLLLQAVVQGSSASGLFPSLTLYPGPALFPGGVSDSFTTYDWLAIDQVTRDRTGSILADPWRRWTLPYRVVDRPAGGIAAQRTWADLMAECATWSDVLAKYATWQGALVGTPGT